jgi:Protein of unknown function (DUF1638)
VAKPLLIACGALASDLRAVLAQLGLTDAIEIRYLPAPHHSRPERIVPAIREQLAADDDGERSLVFGYGDCGTGGHLDRLLDEIGERAARLPGDHCYEFMAGSDVFAALHEAEPGTFYLTDFLAKHFDALVWGSLGLDRHPELRDAYFGNYRRVVLLSQSDDPAVEEAGRRAAQMLGLEFEHVHVGRERFAQAVSVSLHRSVA